MAKFEVFETIKKRCILALIVSLQRISHFIRVNIFSQVNKTKKVENSSFGKSVKKSAAKHHFS